MQRLYINDSLWLTCQVLCLLSYLVTHAELVHLFLLALVHTLSVFYLQTTENLVRLLQEANITIIRSEIFMDDPTPHVKSLKVSPLPVDSIRQ